MSICQVTACFTQNFQLKILGKNDGLPEGTIKRMVQDQSGFILVETDRGISRYNGHRFTSFDHPFYQQLHLYQGKDGQTIGWDDKGIYQLSISSDSIEHKLVFSCDRPKTIFQASDHTFWVALQSGKILHQINNRVVSYTTTEPMAKHYFLETRHNGVMIISENGNIFHLASSRATFTRFFSAPMPLQVYDILIDDSSKVWLASNEGLLRISLTDTSQHFQFVSPQIKSVRCLLLSSEKELYVGTNTSGLFQVTNWYTQPSLKELNIVNNPQNWEKIPFSYYRQIFQTYDHSIWIINEQKIGVFKPTFFDMPFRSIPFGNAYSMCQTKNKDYFFICSTDFSQIKLRNRRIQTIKSIIPYPIAIQTDGTNLWLTTADSKIYFLDSTTTIKRQIDLSQRGSVIFYALADSHKQLWFCQTFSSTPIPGISRTDSALKIKHYGPEKGLSNRILVARETPDSTLYLGGMGERSYLYVYNPYTDAFINLSVALPFDAQGFETHDIAIDSQKNVWMATSHGLLKYDAATQKISRIFLGDFLTTREIRAVMIDRNGLLWIATESLGLFCYKNNAMVSYPHTTGLPSNVMTYRGLYQDRNGNMWVATNQGFCMSKSPLMVPPVTPQPVLASLRFNNKSISTFSISQEVRIASNSTVDVVFTSLTYPANTIKYQYRLLGSSSAWSAARSQNYVHLANLPAGNYVLEVIAQQQGYWPSNPFQLYFHINQIWYKQPWAYVLYVLAAIGFIGAAIRFNTWRLEKEKTFLARLIQEKTEELTLKHDQLQEKQTELATLNNNILLQNEELQRQTEQLANQRDYIEIKNNEIIEQKDELAAINENLDALVKDRTAKIAELNQQLIEYAFFNSHKVRGPLARILGLIQLFELEEANRPHSEKALFYAEQLKSSALELDAIIHEINNILSNENYQLTFLNKLRKMRSEKLLE